MYRPLELKSLPQNSQVTSVMGKGGLDLSTLPQMMDLNHCLDNTNYFIKSDPGLDKREGHTELFNITGTDGIVMFEKYTDDLYMIGYKNTVAVYRISTDTVTDIKTDFVYDGQFSGQKYGDYFFVASPSDAIGRISQTLDYDGQTGNFTVGQIVTGTTSGATAVILEDSDSGATGTLTLGSITGTFLNNEPITDPLGGAAVVDGVLDFTYTALTAPMALVIKAAGARMYAGLADGSVHYSAVDTGANPPFTNWVAGTGGSDPGTIAYRNAGRVNSIEPLGALMLVFGDTGKWAFHSEIQDSSGTLKKVDITDMFRNDLGGGRGAKTTKAGLAYVNSQGLWLLVAVGQQNIKYSDQESVATLLLGTKYFDDFDYSNCDIAYLPKKQTLLLTGAKDSDKNNIILTYHTGLKANGRFRGMNIMRFMDDNGTLYGTATNSNTVFKLFDGNSDNGNEIWTSYKQEIRTGSLEQLQTLLGQYAHGFLSPSSEITISFDIYTNEGVLVEDKLKLLWTVDGSAIESDGYSTASWGTSSIGGDTEAANLVEDFCGGRERINNYQRLIIKFFEHSKLRHSISWFSLQTRQKSPIRRRTLTNIT